jgi:uncharacterized protein
MTNRRHFHRAGVAGLLTLASALTACGSAPSAPLRWYRLPIEPPEGEPQPVPGANASSASPRWQLAAQLPMPELLERDTLLFEEGATGIRLLHGHRWAEPLRDTLPRLLRHDLGLWVPGLWTGTAPARLPGTGLLQLELLGLQGSLPRRQVALSARWVVTPPVPPAVPVAAAATGPRAWQVDLVVPWTDGATESLVLAQRRAIWRLAQRVAASLNDT